MEDESFPHATLENLEVILHWVRTRIGSLSESKKWKMECELAVEEWIVNVILHAYKGKGGTVRILFHSIDNGCKIKIIDRGNQFDPVSHKDPPDIHTNTDIQSVKEGGLGISFVKKMVDRITYERKAGENIVTMEKFFGYKST